MNFKNNTEEILSQLDKIKHILEQYEDPSLIPNIERDILLSDIRKIYEKLLLPAIQKTDIHKAKESLTGEIDSGKMAPEDSERIEFIHENLPSQEIITETPQTTDTSDKPKSIRVKKSNGKEKTKIETVADKFQSDRQYVYESLAEKSTQQNISSKLQSKPISDIALSIGINDKFKLIRDLFNNDIETYNKTIEKLNNASNFNEAFNYISTNFSWDMEDESVQFILDLVRRKFIIEKNE